MYLPWGVYFEMKSRPKSIKLVILFQIQLNNQTNCKSIHMIYRDPTEEEKSGGDSLKDCYIEIYWDGDNLYYPGRVLGYDPTTDKHLVLYDGECEGSEYLEDLRSSVWRIGDPSTMTDEEVAAALAMSAKVSHAHP